MYKSRAASRYTYLTYLCIMYLGYLLYQIVDDTNIDTIMYHAIATQIRYIYNSALHYTVNSVQAR